MLQAEALVAHLSRLLRQVHSLGAPIRVVVATFLVLQEGIVTLDGLLHGLGLLVVSLASGLLGSDDLAGYVKDHDRFCLLDHDIDVSIELFLTQAAFSSLCRLFCLLALGLLVLRRLNQRARHPTLHAQGSCIFLLARCGQFSLFRLLATRCILSLALVLFSNGLGLGLCT